MLHKFLATFHDSETIWIARVKMFIGLSFTALQQSGVDVASLITQDARLQAAIRVFMVFLTLDGTLGEWARRHRDPEFGDKDVGTGS